ncbi:hypothetical protein CASFOL_006775 [Castilleja foliolosa]|uniref:RING-type domain-containing protein n=1 Tax=Castilleja foliolosa TaxID=1961234 RepID=A0ABD3E877_9LAMI
MDFLGKMKGVTNSEKIAEQVPHESSIHNFAPQNVVPGFQSHGLQLLSNTALLAAVEADDHNSITRQIENQRAEVDQIFASHHDSLRRRMEGALHRGAEEEASKALIEKDRELEAKYARAIKLEKKVNQYKKDIDWYKRELNYLETTIRSYKLSLDEETNRERRYAAYNAAKVLVKDDAESSFSDRGLVKPVRLVCKVCDRRMATVVVFPCRHACACTGCVEAVKMCPACGAQKVSTIELRLPHD